MKSRFLMWCIAAGADGESAGLLWLDLGSRYSEPHRHYHTLDHIEASLAHLDEVEVNPAVEGAIWFHDVVYDPTRDDNEAQSAAFFLETTRPWIDPSFAERVHRLILATDFRVAREDDPDEWLMTDIDLAILAAEASEYDAYAKAIRQEYAHVPDEEFRRGRLAVMQRFLEEPVYRSEAFRSREETARENIRRELAALAGG
ncbi:hypothetical protein KBB96_20215 [Luteolibacter ambystomatis]|uniref:N-methyl-D-aspartate receptor NMDAR2C subunit n=1 Tax=Luteolibacter ambystomatis TaxID=2824561 RepID=A0A975IZ72_9BACT|nr:hypothetical protein [Luteolibacter ambystomatis]QUE51166.1 hypothetical protein KBB96_20215 [Luteolibacter ambystomatis]